MAIQLSLSKIADSIRQAFPYADPSRGDAWGKGYQGYSQSANAALARERGELTAPELARALKSILAVTADDIRTSMTPVEHHTSKFYNRTQFFSVAELLEDEETLETLIETAELRREYIRKLKIAKARGLTMHIAPDTGRDWHSFCDAKGMDAGGLRQHLDRINHTLEVTA